MPLVDPHTRPSLAIPLGRRMSAEGNYTWTKNSAIAVEDKFAF